MLIIKTMKYTFYIVLMFGIFNVNLTYAQHLPKSGDNFPNHRLKKFAGLWVSTHGIDTIKIRFNFENIKLPMNMTADALVGYILYKKGSQVIENTIKNAHLKYECGKSSMIIGVNDLEGNLTGWIRDGQTSQSFKYEFIPSSDLNTMTAVLQLSERIYVNEKPGKGYPNEMVFRRE